jgi:hypothetical protein
MEKMIVAAVSARNLIGRIHTSIDHMHKWVAAAREKGADPIDRREQ